MVAVAAAVWAVEVQAAAVVVVAAAKEESVEAAVSLAAVVVVALVLGWTLAFHARHRLRQRS